MIEIKKGTLEALVLAARNTYPNEFIAMLSSKKKNNIIDEYVLLPSTYGRTFSSIRLDLLPYDEHVLGIVHSHPGPNAMPSKADKKAFKKMGKIHLIIASPFTLETVNAFDRNGEQTKLNVIE